MGTLGLIVWTAVLCGLHIKKSADDVGSDGDPSTASDEAAARSAAAIALLIYCSEWPADRAASIGMPTRSADLQTLW